MIIEGLRVRSKAPTPYIQLKDNKVKLHKRFNRRIILFCLGSISANAGFTGLTGIFFPKWVCSISRAPVDFAPESENPTLFSLEIYSVKSTEKIAKSAALVSVAVFFSRVLGLIREQIFCGAVRSRVRL